MNVDQYISSGILELYAANALPPEEMREVGEMVEKYPRIKDELEAIIEGLQKYAALYTQQPGPDLYEKIIARIKDAPATVIQPETRTIPIVPINHEKQLEKEADNPTVKQQSSGNGRYLMLIAASILLLLVSAAFNIYLYNQYNDAQGRLVALQTEKDALANDVNAAKAKYDQTADQLKLYTDPHNKMVMMKGMPISPASEVMVMWNSASKEVYLDVHRLPPPPDGMQYQLWAIDTEGKPVDAGMLTPYKERATQGPQPMKKITNAVAFAITLEKRGGSTTPSVDKMYVKGEV